MGKRALILTALLVMLISFNAYALDLDGIEPHEYTAILENATEEDMTALEQVVYWESVKAFEPYEEGSFECSVAVIETVLNRVLSENPYFKDSIYGVCHQKHQFVCKPFKADEAYEEMISDAISNVVQKGRMVTESTDYTMFATKKQTLAKDHRWYGKTNNGKPVRGKGMWFGVLK